MSNINFILICRHSPFSIWHPGHHDNPFGQRLSTFMISQKIADSAVPMSLLSLHDDVVFNFYRHGFGVCDVEMH